MWVEKILCSEIYLFWVCRLLDWKWKCFKIILFFICLIICKWEGYCINDDEEDCGVCIDKEWEEGKICCVGLVGMDISGI